MSALSLVWSKLILAIKITHLLLLLRRMRHILTDDTVPFSQSVSLSVCVTRLRYAKSVGRIEVLFWVEILGYPGHIALDGGTHHPRGGE